MVFIGISPEREDISLDIHNKGHNEVQNKRRSHGKERNINKPESDAAGGNTKPVTQSSANTKKVPLNKVA